MKQKLLLLVAVVLLSSANMFADSDRYTWGYWDLEAGNFSSAVYDFEQGHKAGYWDCTFSLSQMYMMGLGTSKNPSKALSLIKQCYPQNTDDATSDDIAFWFRFYSGDDMHEFNERYLNKIVKELYDLPKCKEFYNTGKFTCKAFGVSPNIGEAIKYLKQLDKSDAWDAMSHLNDEAAHRIWEYAKKVNDENIISLLKKVDYPIAEYYYNIDWKNDSIKFAQITKNTDNIEACIPTLQTEWWKAEARGQYIEIAIQEMFKDGVYNPNLNLTNNITKCISEITRAIFSCKEGRYSQNMYERVGCEVFEKLERIKFSPYYLRDDGASTVKNKLTAAYMKKQEETFLQTFFALVEKQEWEKATQFKSHFENTIANNTLSFYKAYTGIQHNIEHGTITTKELLLFKQMIDESKKTYANDRAYMAKFGFTRSETLLDEISTETQVALDQLIAENSAAWNVDTDTATMNEYKFISDNAIKKQVLERYNKIALAKAESWTADTDASVMDQVIEMAYLTEDTKTQVLKLYQNAAWGRMAPLAKAKSRDKELINSTAAVIYNMKYVNIDTKQQVDGVLNKLDKKSVSLFHIGAEVSADITGGLQASNCAIGGSILLGRPSQLFNIYAGALYTWHDGTWGSTTLEDVHIVTKEDGSTVHYDDFGIMHTRIEIPVELRYNLNRSNHGCVYIGAGVSYNQMKAGKLYAFAEDYADNWGNEVYIPNKTILELTDGMNKSYLAARMSLGFHVVGLDLSTYLTYNLSSPYNLEGTNDQLSEFPGYVQKQMSSKLTAGVKLGIFF